MRTNARLMGRLVLALAVVIPVISADAQEERRGRGRRPGTGREATEKKSEQPPKPAKKSPVVAIVGADVHTVTQEVIRRGTVLIQDGKILKVGQDITVPEGAKVIDATGKVVTPGFVAVNMSGVGLRTMSSSSRSRLTDSLDPFDRNIKLTLGVGITTGCIQGSTGSRSRRRGAPEELFPGLQPKEPIERGSEFDPEQFEENTSVCACCGLPIIPTEPNVPPPTSITSGPNAVIKMSYGTLDKMLVEQNVFLEMSASALSGQLNRHNWRQNIAKARKYLADQAQHEKNVKAGKKDSKPPRKPVNDNIIRLVKKEVTLRTSADSASQIQDMVSLAKELDYKVVINGATEGWLVADQLSDASVPVIITPRRRVTARADNPDRSGSSIESSAIFESSGVPFAVSALRSSISMMGLAGRDLTSLPLEAAFAVRGGCSEATALQAITIVPARMLGVDDRLGSIEPGKDADLLILNGPPLDYRTYVEQAIVNGRVCYDRAKDRVYPVFDR